MPWAVLDTSVYIDALIALTARRHGATVVSTNRGDFDLLSRAIGVRVLAV